MERESDYPAQSWILGSPERLAEDERSMLRQLLIVPGHALLRDEAEAGRDSAYYQNKDHWYLADYQKGEFDQYMEHIAAGVEALKQSSDALLVFSGGRTRPGQEKWSEAGSYLTLARSMPGWDLSLESRVRTEDFARDSFQNLCFSYFRYLQEAGRQPERIRIFGSAFKGPRFDWHRESLSIPAKGFEYVGVNNPPENKLGFILKSEEAHLAHYRKDPYGLSEELMRGKAGRDPHGDGNPYGSLAEELPESVDKAKLRSSFGGRL